MKDTIRSSWKSGVCRRFSRFVSDRTTKFEYFINEERGETVRVKNAWSAGF